MCYFLSLPWMVLNWPEQHDTEFLFRWPMLQSFIIFPHRAQGLDRKEKPHKSEWIQCPHCNKTFFFFLFFFFHGSILNNKVANLIMFSSWGLWFWLFLKRNIQPSISWFLILLSQKNIILSLMIKENVWACPSKNSFNFPPIGPGNIHIFISRALSNFDFSSSTGWP